MKNGARLRRLQKLVRKKGKKPPFFSVFHTDGPADMPSASSEPEPECLEDDDGRSRVPALIIYVPHVSSRVDGQE